MEKSLNFLDNNTLVEKRSLLIIRENKLLRVKRWDIRRITKRIWGVIRKIWKQVIVKLQEGAVTIVKFLRLKSIQENWLSLKELIRFFFFFSNCTPNVQFPSRKLFFIVFVSKKTIKRESLMLYNKWPCL